MQKEKLFERHEAFWRRELSQAIVNTDCSSWRRVPSIPALPDIWMDREPFIIDPATLEPRELQPPPLDLGTPDNSTGETAFNVLLPYWRIPWVAGIVGCDLKVTASSGGVWPESTLDDDWYRKPDQGFSPNLEWLDKLLEFIRYAARLYHLGEAVVTADNIARGPGDLMLHLLSPDRLYAGFYDHPDEIKSLLERITDYYIRWASEQLKAIPRLNGGYCNQYGIWSPGTFIRTQEDYAMTLSRDTFREFILPAARRVADSFEYQVFHTHSGFPPLADWMMEVENLKCIEVAIDPHGPTYEELIPQWNRILEEKCLLIMGATTQKQLDYLLSNLTPNGLWLDTELFTEEELADAWSFDKSEKYTKR